MDNFIARYKKSENETAVVVFALLATLFFIVAGYCHFFAGMSSALLTSGRQPAALPDRLILLVFLSLLLGTVSKGWYTHRRRRLFQSLSREQQQELLLSGHVLGDNAQLLVTIMNKPARPNP